MQIYVVVCFLVSSQVHFIQVFDKGKCVGETLKISFRRLLIVTGISLNYRSYYIYLYKLLTI